MQDKNAKIVITGAAGLVGQNLIVELEAQGYTRLVAIDMHAYAKRLTVATLLARSKMADLESQLMSEDLPADDTAEEGTFEDDGFPEYHWHAEIIRPKTENVTPAQLLSMAGLDAMDPNSSKSGSSSSSSSSGLMGMLGAATGAPSGMSQGQGTMMASAASGGAGLLGGAMTGQVQTMLDMLGKSVREVHLTVSWKTGKVVDKFTVVTHVVSFGRDTATNNSDPAAQAAQGGIPGLPGFPGMNGMPGARPGFPGLNLPGGLGSLGMPRPGQVPAIRPPIPGLPR